MRSGGQRSASDFFVVPSYIHLMPDVSACAVMGDIPVLSLNMAREEVPRLQSWVALGSPAATAQHQRMVAVFQRASLSSGMLSTESIWSVSLAFSKTRSVRTHNCQPTQPNTAWLCSSRSRAMLSGIILNRLATCVISRSLSGRRVAGLWSGVPAIMCISILSANSESEHDCCKFLSDGVCRP